MADRTLAEADHNQAEVDRNRVVADHNLVTASVDHKAINTSFFFIYYKILFVSIYKF
ncbi:MAG: hypothetical protein ACK55Z_13355 [bacterium]